MRSYAARKQPQLSIEELCHLQWLLGGVLALLSVWTLFYLEASIWPFALVATIAIAGTMVFPGLPARVPRGLRRLGVPLIAAVFILDVTTNEVVLSLVRLNTMLVMFRAVSYRKRRDDLQLLLLSLFLVVLTGVLTVSLAFVFQILLFTGVGMALLFVTNVVEDATAGSPVPPAVWTRISRPRLLSRLRQACDLRMFVLAGALFAAVLFISSVIFMAIPRFEMSSPVNLFSFNKGGSLTGFSESIALGEVTDIKSDNAVAMRVDPRAGAVMPSVPYWRMVALDEYENGAFRVSQSVRDIVGERSLPHLDLAPLTRSGSRGRPDSSSQGRIALFIEPGVSRYLPQPGAFSEMHFRETQEIISNDLFQVYATQRQSAVLLSYQIDGADFSGVIRDDLFAQDRRGQRSLAGRRVGPRPELAAGDSSRTSGGPVARAERTLLAYPQTALDVPVSDEAKAYLMSAVAEITGGETISAAEFALRACLYLERKHAYSMQVRLPPGEPGKIEDPVIRWMKSGTPGHCEFFAAAFTLLGRTAGHPVRVITGFKGGTWNSFENYLMVRHSDAHAWCEIHDGEGSWLRVDPTPGSAGGVSSEGMAGLDGLLADRSTSAYLDSLRMLWYRRIVNFDQRSQRGVAASLQKFGQSLQVWTGAATQVVRAQYRAWQDAPFSFGNKGDILYLSVVLFFIAVLMKRLGIGTSDVMEWFRRGDVTTRRRAGELLRRLEMRVANPPRRKSWNEDHALMLAGHLTVIRFGRTESWPEPLPVFRAVRRIL